MKYYTGVGARLTPPDILKDMYKIGQDLAIKGYTLRSGGANGADATFESGCNFCKGGTEIYLPWRWYNNHPSELYTIGKEAYDLAAKIHPAWHRCTHGVRSLHARNCYQVLGKDLKTPSEFLICWTVNGEDVGGTRTAIVLARMHKIPVYNLFNGKFVL